MWFTRRGIVYSCILTIIAGTFATSLSARASTTYVVTAVSDPSATAGTGALAISGSGEVAGVYFTGSGPNGFIDIGGVYTTIDDPFGTNGTYAIGVNNSGVVAGSYFDSSGHEHGFIFSGGTFTTIDDPLADPGGFGSGIFGINDTGVVSGQYYSGGMWHGFIDSGGVFTTIDFPGAAFDGTHVHQINNSSEVTGFFYSSSLSNARGFTYVGGSFSPALVDPSGAPDTRGTGINDLGTVVGTYHDVSGKGHGFLYAGGSFTTIDYPLLANVNTNLQAINDFGQIVGYYNPVGCGPCVSFGFVLTPIPVLPPDATVNEGNVLSAVVFAMGNDNAAFLFAPLASFSPP
jgi:probable HAF family extracellular repeat protein